MVNRKNSKFTILLNPSSGRKRAFRNKDDLESALLAAGLNFEIIMSQSEKHLRELVRQEGARADALIAAGGDSTLTIVAHEMIEAGLKLPTGIIPLGSSDDIAREYHIYSMSDAIQALAKGKLTYIDAGYFQSKPEDRQYFCGQANIGIGVEVNRYVASKAGTLFGGFQTLVGISGILSSYRSQKESLYLEIYGENNQILFKGNYTSALFSKIRYWATGKIYAPEARYDGGRLFGVFVDKCNLFHLVRILLASANGKHGKFKEVRFNSARHYRIQSNREFFIQVDGDIAMDNDKPRVYRSVDFGVRPKALQVFTNL